MQAVCSVGVQSHRNKQECLFKPQAHCNACSSCGVRRVSHTSSVSCSIGKKVPWPSGTLGGKGAKQRPKSAIPLEEIHASHLTLHSLPLPYSHCVNVYSAALSGPQ